MRQITVNGLDVSDGVRALLDYVDWEEFFSTGEDELDDAVALLTQVAEYSNASYVAYVLERRRKEIIESQRRYDEWARVDAERVADRAKAAAQLATEMRGAGARPGPWGLDRRATGRAAPDA
jgi:hypothetical protein